MSGGRDALVAQLERRAQEIKAEMARLKRELTEVKVMQARALGIQVTENRLIRRNPALADVSHPTKARSQGGNHSTSNQFPRQAA